MTALQAFNPRKGAPRPFKVKAVILVGEDDAQLAFPVSPPTPIDAPPSGRHTLRIQVIGSRAYISDG